jgi:2-oxo-4-hydroxy-4-carboxy--5-ureidoimidazoline (OHCU) decarboxylase
MSASRLPPVTSIPHLSTIERATILDTLFEPSTALHTLSVDLLHTAPFTSYDALINAIGQQLTSLADSPSTGDKEWLDKILGAHPRLGAKKVDSEQSKAEQAQLQTGKEGEAEELTRLNDEYEKRFDALIYVTFVNGRGRGEIMEDMRKRIERGDLQLERRNTIQVMLSYLSCPLLLCWY